MKHFPISEMRAHSAPGNAERVVYLPAAVTGLYVMLRSWNRW